LSIFVYKIFVIAQTIIAPNTFSLKLCSCRNVSALLDLPLLLEYKKQLHVGGGGHYGPAALNPAAAV
jgi:hypothetical protein